MIKSVNPDSDLDEHKSKSQIKREAEALRGLGRELVELPNSKLKKTPLTDELMEAVLDAKRFKREAQRRQISRIAKLLREEDAEAIRKALENMSRPRKEEVKVLHEVEQWRDGLIDGDNALLNYLVGQFKNADRQHMRQLARNAKNERDNNKPPKSARLLYQ